MQLAGYCCWDPQRVHVVMNADAEHVPDELFLAVHTEYPVTLVDPKVSSGSDDSKRRITAREFLEQFLDPARPHVQAVVIGQSGAGKSHFIKWLALNIPPDPHRKVLVIPRAGLSLRGILVRLIDELPPEKQPQYRARLTEIGYETADRDIMREELCNSIAVAIKSAQPQDEVEEWLVQELPNLFYDPALRQILNQRKGAIDELVDHIFKGPTHYERLESQRLFRREDLPLGYTEIAKLSAPTQEVVRFLQGDEETIEAALKLINQNLNKAIAHTLHFTGDQLIELMHDVRRGLKAEGQSLILLIEDFARLQGVDGALLQALIEPATPENGLCELRWAMAVTRGYYERQVPATVQTRMHFLVDMDVPVGDDPAGVTQSKVVALAARYLNAARVTAEELKHWHDARQRGSSEAQLPNRCATCALRATCHDTFGEVDGFGLYPFTASAILNMIGRRDPDYPRRFNPRILLTDVLRPTLGDHADEIAARKFPSKSYLERMGGTKFAPAILEQLRSDDPVQYERRLALASLWCSDPTQWEDLPEGLYRAFGLTPPTRLEVGAGARRVVPGEEAAGKTPQPTPRPKTETDRLIEQVQEWGRGGKLQDYALNKLRDYIRADLIAFIDWDGLGLQPDAINFVGRSISFVDQMTRQNPPASGVSLKIPLDETSEQARTTTAMALEGMLRFRERGDWDFPNGAMMMEAYAEALAQWADHIIRQVTDLTRDWNPTVSIVELLTIDNALAGVPADGDAALVDWVNALFTAPPPSLNALSEEWAKLSGELRRYRQDLQSLLHSTVAGSKGRRLGAFIDPTNVCGAIEACRSSWGCSRVVPEDAARRLPSWSLIRDVQGKVQRALDKAIAEEIRKRTTLAQAVRAALSPDYSWADLVADLRALIEAERSVHVSKDVYVEEALMAVLENAENLDVASALAEVSALESGSKPDLALLGRSHCGQVLTRAKHVLEAAERYLAILEEGVKKDLTAVGQAHQVDQYKATIDECLRTLEQDLCELGGGSDA